MYNYEVCISYDCVTKLLVMYVVVGFNSKNYRWSDMLH